MLFPMPDPVNASKKTKTLLTKPAIAALCAGNAVPPFSKIELAFFALFVQQSKATVKKTSAFASDLDFEYHVNHQTYQQFQYTAQTPQSFTESFSTTGSVAPSDGDSVSQV